MRTGRFEIVTGVSQVFGFLKHRWEAQGEPAKIYVVLRRVFSAITYEMMHM